MISIENYLKRLNLSSVPSVTADALSDLHERHVFKIPFENLDVRFKRRFGLEIKNVCTKVFENNRGGFCYELNLIFNELLKAIGFTSHLIAARISNDDGTLGPAYDHMAIYVDSGNGYLADVGYGDLFLKPLEVKTGIQHDGRNFFKIENHAEGDFLLSMSANGNEFSKRYRFNLKEVFPADFETSCADKQTNPDSYFVKNTVCTLPTLTGRITVFNSKFIETTHDQKTETSIDTEEALRVCLQDRFGIAL